MTTMPYTDAEYPHGRRCSSCNHLFTEGEPVVFEELGDLWIVGRCEPCADAGAPLKDGHPLLGPEPTLLADGTVR